MSDLVERLGSDARRGVVATYIAGNTLATIGVLLVLVLMVLALAGPLLVPHDPLEQSFLSASQGPSAESWFGTDPSAATSSLACCSARARRWRSA